MVRIPNLQFRTISALSWVDIKYINMVTNIYVFYPHRIFIGDYPVPLWSHGATHKTGSHTPSAGCLTRSGAPRAGSRHWPPAGSPPPAPLPSHTLWIFLYPVCLMADTRQPASHTSAKRSRGLQSGRRRTCTPRPQTQNMPRIRAPTRMLDGCNTDGYPGRRPPRRRRARISCAAGGIAAPRRGHAPPSGTGARAPVNGRRARS